MNKKQNVFMVVVLLANLLIQPLVNISTVFAQDDEASLEILSQETVVSEPVIEEAPPEISEEVSEEPPIEEPEVPVDVETSEPSESDGSEDEETDESEEEESSEEEQEAVTAISYLDNGNQTSNLRTGSTSRFSFNVQNTGNTLENAIIRVMIPLTHLETYGALGQYFPGQGIDSLLSSRVEGNHLIVDYNVQTLSENYNQNFTFEFKSIDDGSMPNGAQIPVQAAVVESGSTVAQTSNVTYQFVTRQPHFSTNVTYPAEASDEDDEDAQRPTEVLFSFSFGDEGGGNGSGRSAVNSITVTAIVPESLTFDASYNEAWQYDEASRTASYSFTPDASIYDAAYSMPATLSLVATNDEEDIQESIYAEATFAFANGDVVTKSNQAEVSMMAAMDIAPMAALDGNYISGFNFILTNKDGEIINVPNNGASVEIDPTAVDYIQVGYDFTFPADLDINANDTYEITLPDVINISARTSSIQPTNGPLVNYEVTSDGRVIFTFTEDWNNDDRSMHIDMQANIDVQLFEEKREVEVNVPYVDGEGFHAVLVGKRDGVEGADIKTGNTFNAENEETNFRPEYAEWTIRVNDTLESYENASVIDTLSAGHTLAEDSIEIYRIPRNYLTGAVTGDPVLIDPSEYTSSSDASSFAIGFGSIEDTYEIRYRTNIDYETVESNTTINNTARIILDGNETVLDHPIDLEWGNDFVPIVKSGAVDSNDRTRINWEVRYNFASHSLGEVTLTDIIDSGTVDLSTVEVFEVGVDGNGNPTGWNEVEEVSTINDDGNAIISIPDSNGKSYVIRFSSDVPGNYVGSVTNKIDDNNPSTPPGEAVVEVDTSPGGDKSGTVKYDDEGIPYIEWNVTFNTNRVVFDGFSFTDTFNGDHLQLVEDSFVLTHSDGATLTQGTHYNVTPSDLNAGFAFTLSGESEKEVYTLTYRTNYTPDGLKEGNVSNSVDWGWDGEGIGPGIDVGHPVAGINKTGNYITGTVDDEGIVTNRQEIAWRIEFNTNKLVLETPKLVDTFSPAELDIVSGTFNITTGDTTLVEGTDYQFTRTVDGFEVQFIGNSKPAVYVVEYRTTIPAGNDASSINAAQLEWQGNVERDTADVDLGQNTPGSYKDGSTVAYEEDGETLKKNEWDIRFNTNKRIIQNLVLTDTYSPGEIVDQVVITDVDNNAVLGVGDDYTITHTDGEFVITFTKQTEPVEYSLTYSTSYNLVEDRQDAVNSYEISFLGGTEEGSKTIAKPILNVQKASTGVAPATVDEDGKLVPAVISWEITGNTDGPNYVYLKNAVFEDIIQSDQRFIDGTMKLNGEPVTPTWTGTPEENNYKFTVTLEDGAAEHTLTYETEIYNFQSNDLSDPSRYHNTVDLINFKGNEEGTEEKVSDSSSARYFDEHNHVNPTKTGAQDPEDELIKWEAVVNANGLPIKNGQIRDILDEHLVYEGIPEVYAVINGTEVLVPVDGYTYSEIELDGNPAFTITFNGPTSVTPDEEANGVHYAYKLKYNTSLRDEIIGTRQVSNKIQVLGNESKVIEEIISVPTYSEQWSFGGGGSSRILTMKFSKVDADNNTPLNGVSFELYRVSGAGNSETLVSSFETLADGSKEIENQRAGRYVLREITALPNYILGDPVYFIIGYDEEGYTVLDITDSNFSTPRRLDSDLLTIENERQKINVTANKIWEGESSNHPTVWFKLYRQVGEEGTPEAAPEEIKVLAPGTTQVSWNGVDKLNPDGMEYIYTIQEVDGEGDDNTPIGYTKSEEGLTVTNTESPIEINVTKVWEDADNQDGIRPDSIEVQLTANGTNVGQPIELNSSNDWSTIFSDLPAYNGGTLIDYSVVETNVPESYEVRVNNEDQQNIILTNTHTPATTELTVKKAWDDGDDQDGLRPESVKVQLMAGEESIGEPIELTAETGWTHTWSDLPVNDSGSPIVYTVEETDVPTAYEATQEVVDGIATITNTHNPAVTEVPVNKVWNDADDQDGLRPESITANLLANGTQIDTVELSEDNEWKHVFENLPVYDNGEEISYTITENAVEQYSTEIVEGLITNNYTPEETSVTVTKDWQDGNNQDGNRPGSIEVQLTADGVTTNHTAVLNEENNWTATWSGLALNSDGTAIDYSVEEITAVDGYEIAVNDADHGNIILTNRYEPAVTDLTVNKLWDDAENQDGIRSESVEIQLIAGNQEHGDPVTLNANNNWSYTWTDLAVNAAGEAIEYSLVEVNVPEGYTSTINEIEEGVITITNLHTPEVTNIQVTKAWDDADNQDGIRPESITVELRANGDSVGEPVELNADNSWTHTWSDLAVNAAGEAIEYEVIESEIPAGYEVDVNSENPEEVVITNTHIPAVTELTVNKVWDDSNNQDGLRPESIQVQLMAGEDAVGNPVTLDGASSWTHTWTELPANASGEPIDYSVIESNVPEGYEATIGVNVDGVITIKNAHTPAVVNIPVSKVWDDAENQDGVRPETITANLLADGDPVGNIELSADNEWTHTFENLPVYNDGSIINYTVTEDTVEDYSTMIEGTVAEGFAITNSYTPDETSVTVTKNWQDGNNQDGNRPESIEVQLTADGEATDHTAVLTEENNWTATWSGLALNSDGTAIDYSVEETTVVEGYEVVVDAENHGNIILTNRYEPAVTDLTVNKLWDDAENQDGIQPGNIEVRLIANSDVYGEPVELNAGNNWSYTWTDLAVNAAGEAIEYSLVEVNVPEGYTSTISEIEEGVITVTNIHEPEVTSIKVSKAWDDADNQDGIRPESITVELRANGDSVAEPVELNADNSWTHTWSDLAVNAAGEAIDYEVIESDVPEGYEVGINSENPKDIVITNTHLPAVTELTVNKVWDDSNNQDGLRPESIQVQLMAGEDAVGNPVILDGASSWTHTWAELPANASGEPIDYSVIESNVPEGYEATVGENVEGIITITNTHTPAIVNIPVSKVWDDSDNQDGNRPESVTVNLLADGATLDSIELNSENEWTHTFENLPVNHDGEEVSYTVTEDTVEDYSTMIKGTVAEGFVITNSYTPDETSVTVTKNWQDGNNQYGNRPGSIEVQLTADGEATDHTAVLNEENNWTATWSGLALNSDGTAINYSVVETTIPEGYEVSIDDENHGNIIITNSYAPELVEISGNKLWEDNNNEGNTRPESITINLLLDNEVIDTQEVTANADGDWLYNFQDLPELPEGSSYSVQEVEVKGYKATYGEDGTITNKLTPTDPKNPTGPTSPGNPNLPSTGDTSWAWYGLMVLALGSAVIFTGRRRKEKE